MLSSGQPQEPHPPKEKRLHKRHRLDWPIYLKFDSHKRATIVDISECGLGFQGMTRSTAGHVIDVEFSLPMTAQIAVAGEVIWANRQGRSGLKFLNLTDEARSHILEWTSHHSVSASGPQSQVEQLSEMQSVLRQQLERTNQRTPLNRRRKAPTGAILVSVIAACLVILLATVGRRTIIREFDDIVSSLRGSGAPTNTAAPSFDIEVTQRQAPRLQPSGRTAGNTPLGEIDLYDEPSQGNAATSADANELKTFI